MKAKIKIITAMFIWGSMGVFARYIDLPSGEIALARGVIGALFLLMISVLMKKPFPKKGLANNKWLLLISGAALGINWIFLFEAYKHTTIAIATLSYYLAPIIIAIVSPLIFKEKLTWKKVMCSITALLGLALISGVLEASRQGVGNGLGILFGVAAAMCYASLTLVNKFVKNISSMDATMTQFAISAVVLLPYTIIRENLPGITVTWESLALLLILGIVHTGLAFWLFFSAIRDLRAQTIAVLSYLDPVTAVLMSALVLKESIGLVQVIGACIILSSALISEYDFERKTPVKHRK